MPNAEPGYDRIWFRDMLLSAPDELPTEVVDYRLHGAALGAVVP